MYFCIIKLVSKYIQLFKFQVPQKFRYPFFTEMLWYVLDRYVSALLGRTHLAPEGQSTTPTPPKEHVHLTQNELHGLKVMLNINISPQ